MTQSEVLPTTAQGLPQLRGDVPLPLKSLLDAGVHFGHQTKRWNPKMRRSSTARATASTSSTSTRRRGSSPAPIKFVEDMVGAAGHLLMIGTKRQAQEIVKEEATRSGSFYVVNRWLGGTLTNFRTIKQGLERMRQLERMKEDGTYNQHHQEGSRAPREGARALREVRRRAQEHGIAPARDLRHRPGQGDHRGAGGATRSASPSSPSPTPTAIRTSSTTSSPATTTRSARSSSSRRASPTPSSTARSAARRPRVARRRASPAVAVRSPSDQGPRRGGDIAARPRTPRLGPARRRQQRPDLQLTDIEDYGHG